ncbi:hypothetical protein MM221_06190 [Salipaludibacillus sp. LMS25]|jgi:uncharacterized membrane protein YvbJ|uniref:TcaA second domain-containing protein n=1 Tax=Salipaludibacillus sp. LMS25 TaxID=2924031 RepID=UPI0020CFEB4E|nr:hypothetical protein [Salipaludibacillus sp. LMS25]UTR16146.1 hypothetical protein MM221_06190 [Salipaludibacillus sp. LMS25]
MNYCKHCGSKQEEGKHFCPSCGGDLRPGENVSSPANPTPSKPTTRQKKMAVAILGGIVVLFSGYKVGDALADGTRVIEHFRTAVEEKDHGTVLKYLHLEGTDHSLSEDHAKDLINFFHDHDHALTGFNRYLDEKSEWLEEGSNVRSEDNPFSSGLPALTFEQTGTRWMLYDRYEFVLQALPLQVDVRQKDISFKVDGEPVDYELTADGLFDLGSFAPGNYDITAELATDFVELEQSVSTSHFFDVPVYLQFNVDDIELTANVDDAELFINGETANMVIGRDANLVGPVLLDGSMAFHIEKETPFGQVSSLPIQADRSYLDLYLEAHETLLEEVQSDLEALFAENSANVYDITDKHIQVLENVHLFKENSYIEQNGSQWWLHLQVTEKWHQDEALYDDDIALVPYEEAYYYELLYNTGSESWTLMNRERAYTTFTGDMLTITLNYEDELHAVLARQEEATKEEYRAEAESYLTYLFNDFIRANVRLINGGTADESFSYIYDGASEYKESIADYADYLDGRNITQTFMGADILEVSPADDDTYTVTTFEDYIIYYEDDHETKRKTFESKYEVKLTNEGFKVVELTKTEEQSSEDW